MSRGVAVAMRRARLATVGYLLGAFLFPPTVHAVESGSVGPARRPGPADQAGNSGTVWLFQARKRLESMGVRDLVPVESTSSESATGHPAGTMGDSTGAYVGRITAPTLAFLHGLCDTSGGLPRFGQSVGLALRTGGVVELRATYLGQLVDWEGRTTALWIWDPSRLEDRVQVRRATDAGPKR
jgi:hypothetical protein